MKPKVYAILGTALVCLLTLLWMACSHLRLTHDETPQMHAQVVVEEEFVDVSEMPLSSDLNGDEEAQATAEDPAAEAQVAPESGTDIEDAGALGEAQPVVTQAAESSVKERDRAAEAAAAAAAEQRSLEEEARRQANDQINNAFSQGFGQHNTTQGDGDAGDVGASGSSSSTGSFNGTGKGRAGKGWSVPQYGNVSSPYTGTVVLIVTFDKGGNVTNVRTGEGCVAPAGTNNAVINACIAEVKRHTFRRTNGDTATEGSYATITYNFK